MKSNTYQHQSVFFPWDFSKLISCRSKLRKIIFKQIDNKINLPAICCALTAVLGLHQPLFHPSAAIRTLYHNSTLLNILRTSSSHRKVTSEETARGICYVPIKCTKEKSCFPGASQLCGSWEATEKWTALSDTCSLNHNPHSSAWFWDEVKGLLTTSHLRWEWPNSLQVHRQRRTWST